MTRLLVNLDEQDRVWLERKARQTGASMAEVVRQSIRHMKKAEQKPFNELLAATSGVWRGGDGLRYQRKVRREWDERTP
jgi:plasmid stability protein